MSDDEEVMHSDEEEGSEEEEEKAEEPSRPSEAQAAMERRRKQQSHSGLDEDAQELLEANKEARALMEEEINELRHRSEQRKRERLEEEKRLAEKRIEEDQKRKAEEEERKRKKEEDERAKKEARAAKMAEFEKWKNPPTPNFVITKKNRGEGGDEEEGKEEENKKSKEQLEAEKQATLKQRIQPLEINGFDAARLSDKAKELHTLIYRLESEKYDLERRFKAQQYDMMELAERARSMNKVGKQGALKRIQLNEDDTDKMQERFAGCPGRIVMYSEYERQKDKRPYGERREKYVGPVYGYPAERIIPEKKIVWTEDGRPEYVDLGGEGGGHGGGAAEEEE